MLELNEISQASRFLTLELMDLLEPCEETFLDEKCWGNEKWKPVFATLGLLGEQRFEIKTHNIYHVGSLCDTVTLIIVSLRRYVIAP